MTKTNGAFTVAFEVVYEGIEPTPGQIRLAALKRILSLPDDEILEAVGAPYDTYEVDDDPGTAEFQPETKEYGKYGILFVEGDVDPQLIDGLPTEEAQDAMAVQLRKDHGEESGIYWVKFGWPLEVGSYSGGFFERFETNEE